MTRFSAEMAAAAASLDLHGVQFAQARLPTPLRDLLAGHTVRLGLLHFAQAMAPFVKAAMKEAFPDRDPADPDADDSDKARHAAIIKRQQNRAADAKRKDILITVELPAAQAEADRMVKEEGCNEKKALHASGLKRLQDELVKLEGLDRFALSVADVQKLVGMAKPAVMKVGAGSGLDKYEQQRLWSAVEVVDNEQKVYFFVLLPHYLYTI